MMSAWKPQSLNFSLNSHTGPLLFLTKSLCLKRVFLEKALDARLRKLQKDERLNGSSKRLETPRKPFITTVKQGHFLEPPPQIACFLGCSGKSNRSESPVKKEASKNLYAYSSMPRVLDRSNGHKARCESAAKAALLTASTVAGVRSKVGSAARDVNCNVTKKAG